MTTPLHRLAKQIINQTKFQNAKEIYHGDFYTKDQIRNIIYDGVFQQKPAVLKIYDDPRFTDEPLALNSFLKHNSSKLLTAPKLYKYKILSPKKGWLIMEKLPESGKFFAQPLNQIERKKFLQLFLNYRQHFPIKPHRPLRFTEKLTAVEYHTFRINKWLKLALDKEFNLEGKTPERFFPFQRSLRSLPPLSEVPSEREIDSRSSTDYRRALKTQELFKLNFARTEKILKFDEFIPRYQKGIALIRKEFRNRKMIWCHGHFKPHEIYTPPNKKQFYLTDFAHVKMYPEGYELAFIIWADWLMSANCEMSYSSWRKGVSEWWKILLPVARTLHIRRFTELMRASLIERIFGSILADVCASDRPTKEKKRRIYLLYRLFDDVLDKKILVRISSFSSQCSYNQHRHKTTC